MNFEEVENILVIEDTPELSEVIDIILSNEGYKVVVASDGNFALDILKSDSSFSLILLDLGLPDMNVSTFLENFNKINMNTEIPIVFISAAVDLLAMSLPKGVVGVISKPFQMDHFINLVQTYKK